MAEYVELGNISIPVIKGEKGNTGVSIASIKKTATEDLIDTYTITYTDGSTDTFEITNGKDATNESLELLTENLGASFTLSIDENYIMTINLLSADGTVLSVQSIDFPIESVVVNAEYNSNNKSIILTLQNGNATEVDVSDLVSGLISETELDNYYTKEETENLVNNASIDTTTIINLVYPVGSYYISANSTSPAELFGVGTWEQIKDTFILGAGDTYENGDTGGEAEHSLTTDEMPTHTHTFTGTATSHTHTLSVLYGSLASNGSPLDSGSYKAGTLQTRTSSSTSITPKGTNSSTGGGEAHNNMPPYIVRYIWERTA